MRKANGSERLNRLNGQLHQFYGPIYKKLDHDINDQIRDQVLGPVLDQLNQFKGGFLYRLYYERSQ